MEQGLPQNSVNSIAQTPDGYIWLATQEGLARFNGAKFQVFDAHNTPELTENYISALFVDQYGQLLIGEYGGGLAIYDGHHFRHYAKPSAGRSQPIVSIQEDASGGIWGGSPGHWRQLEGAEPSDAVKREIYDAQVIAFSNAPGHGSWVVTTDGRLAQFTDGRLRTVANQPISQQRITALYEDRSHSIWFASGHDVFIRSPDGDVKKMHLQGGLERGGIGTIQQDHDGNMWLGGTGGYFRVSFQHKTPQVSEQSLSSSSVGAFFEDREGNLWIGTNGHGVEKLSDSKVRTFGLTEGLSNEMVWSIQQARNGDIWIGTRGGLFRFRDGKFAPMERPARSVRNIVIDSAEDARGNIWAGTNLPQPLLVEKERLILPRYAANPPLDSIQSLNFDPGGNLWIGRRSGLELMRDQRFFGCAGGECPQGIGNSPVYMIYQDRHGGMWVGTDDGVFQFRSGKQTHYGSRDGLASDIVVAMYEAADGDMWFGTGAGISRLHAGTIRNFGSTEGIPTDSVNLLLGDPFGNLWFGTNKGIYNFQEQEADRAANGQGHQIPVTAFGLFNGMKSAETNGGSSHPACFTREGELWFSTVRGVAVIDPNDLKKNLQAPPVVIENVVVNGKTAQPGKTSEFAPGEGNFQVDYACLSFRAPEQTRFRYRLTGFDHGWISAGSRRTAYYTNLSPGTYRFEVMASNEDGVWSTSSAVLSFVLKPHFYQTYWFYLLVALGLSASGVGLYQYRVRTLKKRNLDLERRIDLRTQELTVANRQLLAAKDEAESATRAKSEFLANLSHEIRTPMNAVIGLNQLVLRTPLTAEQREYLEIIQSSGESLLGLLNDILDYSKIESGHLEPEHAPFVLRDCVESVLDMFASASAQKGIRLAYFISDGVPEVTFGDIVRLRQVLINLTGNALKFTARGEVTLAISAQERSTEKKDCCDLRFEVTDTGIGIPQNRLDRLFKSFSQVDASTTRKFGGTGLGLAISQRLVQLMGGRIEVSSKEGVGSCFSFSVAVNVAQWEEQTGITPIAINSSVAYVGDCVFHRKFIAQRAAALGLDFVSVSDWSGVSDALLAIKGDCVVVCDEQAGWTGPDELQRIAERQPMARFVMLVPLGGQMAFCPPRTEYLTVPLKARKLDGAIAGWRASTTEVTRIGPTDSAANPPVVALPGVVLRVLVVDDNPINLRVATAAVKQMGHFAETASSGAAAVEMVANGHYDFVLMDIQMPEMDGFQAAAAICHRLPKERRPLLFAMSADTKESNETAFAAAGMDGWINKPFRISELELLLQSRTSRSSAGRETPQYALQ